jgi:hypothetical protein
VPPKALAVPPQESGVPPKALAVPPQESGVPPKASGVPPQESGVPPKALGVPSKEQKKSSKKTPNEKASDFQVGHVIKSTNDNREYIVKKIIMNKKSSNGEIKKIEFNKWVLKK